MRSWLAILCLALVALQWSGAAVAAYGTADGCVPAVVEQASERHGQPCHDATTGAEPCGHCPCQCQCPVVGPGRLSASASAPGDTLHAEPATAWRTAAPSPPERPQWA